MTRDELEDQIAVLLGGRAAEALHYGGIVSTGAADDLERASALVRQMVTRFGMSEKLGLLTWGKSLTSPFIKSPFDAEERNFGEQTAEIIDSESRRILDETYRRVQEILQRCRGPLSRIADELIRKETLERRELDALVATEATDAEAPPGASHRT